MHLCCFSYNNLSCVACGEAGLNTMHRMSNFKKFKKTVVAGNVSDLYPIKSIRVKQTFFLKFTNINKYFFRTTFSPNAYLLPYLPLDGAVRIFSCHSNDVAGIQTNVRKMHLFERTL